LRYTYYTELVYFTNSANYNKALKKAKTMKRRYRNDMSQSQKEKLSSINKGKRLSQRTKDKISQALVKYWSRLPYKPDTSGTTEGV